MRAFAVSFYDTLQRVLSRLTRRNKWQNMHVITNHGTVIQMKTIFVCQQKCIKSSEIFYTDWPQLINLDVVH